MEVHVAILLLVGAVALIGLLSGALKLHPLFVLIITALVVGVCSGSRSEDAISAVTKGFGACRLPSVQRVHLHGAALLRVLTYASCLQATLLELLA